MEYEYVQGGHCSECKTTEGFEDWHLKSKTTCSPKCRKRRQRRQEQADLAPGIIMLQLQYIRDSIKRGESLEEFRGELQHLKAEISDLLLLAKDPDSMAAREMLEDRARRRA